MAPKQKCSNCLNTIDSAGSTFSMRGIPLWGFCDITCKDQWKMRALISETKIADKEPLQEGLYIRNAKIYIASNPGKHLEDPDSIPIIFVAAEINRYIGYEKAKTYIIYESIMSDTYRLLYIPKTRKLKQYRLTRRFYGPKSFEEFKKSHEERSQIWVTCNNTFSNSHKLIEEIEKALGAKMPKRLV